MILPATDVLGFDLERGEILETALWWCVNY
jgi:hypothetical protein